MTLLLDTHFVVWILTGAERLRRFPWIKNHQPWGVSPVSLLEIQYLSEIGRIKLKEQFFEMLLNDKRFLVDEVPLLRMVRHALNLSWTRDPFDRLLCAHSASRRIPLCTTDQQIQSQHALIAPELTA